MEKKRVAAYVRVSSSSKAQLHSYEFQEAYWQEKFEGDPEHELVSIYADKGISGCSMQKRPQFLMMLQAAKEGKYDVIYTKSVSRFARNTVELLQTVRELRDLGIEVVFEKEQISTQQPTSELFLTIAATIAENELLVDSQRQRWSIQHRFENGWYSIGSAMYGYRMTGDNVAVIVPEEAEVVRWIYSMYLSGCGCPTIARILNAAGIKNSRGLPWRPNIVLKLISNEKYMGDVMMGKSVRIDGRKCDNLDGQYGERFYIENAHEGIVSKETFRKAQELRQRRANPKLIHQEPVTYPFSGLIVCGHCGSRFRHKVNSPGTKWSKDLWICGKQEREGKRVCDCTRIMDWVLRDKFQEAYNEFVIQRPQGHDVETIQSEIQKLQAQEKELAALTMRKLITEKTFRNEQQTIKTKIHEKQSKLRELQGNTVKKADFTVMTEFDESKIPLFLQRITIDTNRVTFHFYNGVEIMKAYTNGQPGNKCGWNQKEA